MEITEIETHLVTEPVAERDHGLDTFLLLEIHTDEGITGIGESGAWGYLGITERAVQTFKRYLVGQDPLQIDQHYQYLYRNEHFRGAALMGALSAIDIALWDIMGKYFDVPVYQLLGGKQRDRVRSYVHAMGDTEEKITEKCLEAKAAGWDAVGHIAPFLDEPYDVPYDFTHAEKIDEGAKRIARYREALGNEVDILVEMSRQLNPHEAIALGREIEGAHPMFYEDPVPPQNIDAMAEVASKINIPIATGERLNNIFEFKMLLNRNAVQYVRPNLGLAGGFTQVKKIAAMAEAQHVDVVPHNAQTPVMTAAGVHLCMSIPNVGIQEDPYKPYTDEASGEALVKERLEREEGYILPSEGPGLGIELDHETIESWEYEPRELKTRRKADGSIVTQ